MNNYDQAGRTSAGTTCLTHPLVEPKEERSAGCSSPGVWRGAQPASGDARKVKLKKGKSERIGRLRAPSAVTRG